MVASWQNHYSHQQKKNKKNKIQYEQQQQQKHLSLNWIVIYEYVL